MVTPQRVEVYFSGQLWLPGAGQLLLTSVYDSDQDFYLLLGPCLGSVSPRIRSSEEAWIIYTSLAPGAADSVGLGAVNLPPNHTKLLHAVWPVLAGLFITH